MYAEKMAKQNIDGNVSHRASSGHGKLSTRERLWQTTPILLFQQILICPYAIKF